MTFAQVLQRFKPHLTLERVQLLTGGIAAEVVILECVNSVEDTQKYVMRWYENTDYARNYHVVEHEFAVLHKLKSLGVPAPTPYYLDESCHIFHTPYLIMEFVEGKPEFTPSDVNKFMRQLAQYLAQIHQLDQAQLQFPFIEPQIINLEYYPAQPNEIASKARIREALAPHLPLTPRNSSLFLHGDFWLGNLLWENGELTAIIDWEDMVYADPLYELAVTRLNIIWAFGVKAMHTLTQHYHSLMPQLDLTHLPHWDLYVALRTPDNFPEWADGWMAYDRADVTRQTFYADYHQFVELAFVELAQSSD